jgi:hypothetical protein
VHLDPERFPRPLVDVDERLQAAPANLDRQGGVVDEPAPLEQVAGRLAVDRQDLVALDQPDTRGRRSGRDGDDTGGRHRHESLLAGRSAPA